MVIDPHSTVNGALAGAAISASSLVLGAQIDALIIGMISAVLVSICMEAIDNKLTAGAAVFFAALLAGYGSPVAAGWLTSNVPSIGTNGESLRMLLALLIGGGAPSSIPVAIRFITRKGDAL